MKKIGIVITDGVGYRNFVLSDFISEAKKNFQEVVILSCIPAQVYSSECDNIKIIELDIFEENYLNWFFRKLKEVAHLQLHKNKNFGIYDNFLANKSKAKNIRGFSTRFIYFLTNYLHSEIWINRFFFLQCLSFKHKKITRDYKKILNAESFDLLFFTHQRPIFIAPIAYEAEQLKIPTASFIFSWDNIASKGRMAANFDYFLVWSELMKNELIEFYPNIKPENIEVVGTPQFEPYVLERYFISKEEFFKKFNLNITKKTICFSCGDITTSKNDELYIETIANFISKKDIPDVNFIVRTSPAEDPIRFKKIADSYSNIIWNYPKWDLTRNDHPELWSQRVPSKEDLIDLRALINFSDLNINMLSTMSLDFITFDKPIINPVFGSKNNKLYDDQRFLNYKHIQYLVNSQATTIVKSEEELLKAIIVDLNDPRKQLKARQELYTLEIGKPLENTSKRIVQSLRFGK
ncbi:hypothetical protein [Flavobacterium aciduliphilum]|uniref:CDP-glycerol:poly(Glycerophosphate) glycerophosphotransferase n=1 Tax=Flavobacterium aciduliphilum TaxID=1101402 RepID=A0A328YFV9_9FLAO|nr:hypothetical protein [Flavobacterium aciduliphilum]RAR69290.1 hypothetical protein CLV55_11611 [Flavobacterium aciduliphilum]